MATGRRIIMAGLAAALVPHRAAAAPRPVVVELFTSQGCSSCPPADALLRELATTRQDVLALGFHVTYWDRLGWRDPLAFEGATLRQRRYAAIAQVGTLYTPQMVVDGRIDVVGSDRRGVLAAIDRAEARIQPTPLVAIARSDAGIAVSVGSGSVAQPCQVLVVGYDPEHRTDVRRGENAGRRLLDANAVRSLTPLGSWTGAALSLEAAMPAGILHAVLVQAPDGGFLAAARLAGATSPGASATPG